MTIESEQAFERANRQWDLQNACDAMTPDGSPYMDRETGRRILEGNGLLPVTEKGETDAERSDQATVAG